MPSLHSSLSIEILREDENWPPESESLIEAALLQAWNLAGEGERASIAVALMGNAAIQRLNRDFRGKDKPTNVLSFVADEDDSDTVGVRFLGDLALAYGVLQTEAHEQGKTFADHLSHLVVHGLLHLMGYDHETDAQALQMETLETEILKAMGIKNPYETGQFMQ